VPDATWREEVERFFIIDVKKKKKVSPRRMLDLVKGKKQRGEERFFEIKKKERKCPGSLTK